VRRHGIGRQLQRSQSGSTPHDRITIPQICSSRSPALNRPRQSALRYPALVSNHPPIHSLRRHPPLNHEPLHRRPTCSIALAPVTHLIRSTQIPIAHAAPPTYPFPRFPCMGLFLSRSSQSGKSVVFRQFLCSISKPVSSSRPALRLRWRAQKLSRLAVAPTLRQALPLPGHPLTASSTTARLVRSG
jgi:hypothetical protein